VPDHDCVLQIEFFKESGEIVGVGVHFVAVPGLIRAAVAPPVMRDDSIAAPPEEQHLPIPVVRAEWPAMRKDNRLAFSPVLVLDVRAVFGGSRCHLLPPGFTLTGSSGLPTENFYAAR
jgi:hypothetical protein